MQNNLKKVKIEGVEIVVKTCIDGEKAVGLFKNLNQVYNLQNIHLIICDFNMLVMNGDIACQKVILIIILDYRDDEWGL